MGIFTEIYSFRLNVYGTQMLYGTQNVTKSFIQFLWGADWIHIQNMCLLYRVCMLIRKYKLPLSFKAAIPCSINKCLWKCCTEYD